MEKQNMRSFLKSPSERYCQTLKLIISERIRSDKINYLKDYINRTLKDYGGKFIFGMSTECPTIIKLISIGGKNPKQEVLHKLWLFNNIHIFLYGKNGEIKEITQEKAEQLINKHKSSTLLE